MFDMRYGRKTFLGVVICLVLSSAFLWSLYSPCLVVNVATVENEKGLPGPAVSIGAWRGLRNGPAELTGSWQLIRAETVSADLSARIKAGPWAEWWGDEAALWGRTNTYAMALKTEKEQILAERTVVLLPPVKARRQLDTLAASVDVMSWNDIFDAWSGWRDVADKRMVDAALKSPVLERLNRDVETSLRTLTEMTGAFAFFLEEYGVVNEEFTRSYENMRRSTLRDWPEAMAVVYGSAPERLASIVDDAGCMRLDQYVFMESDDLPSALEAYATRLPVWSSGDKLPPRCRRELEKFSERYRSRYTSMLERAPVEQLKAVLELPLDKWGVGSLRDSIQRRIDEKKQ